MYIVYFIALLCVDLGHFLYLLLQTTLQWIIHSCVFSKGRAVSAGEVPDAGLEGGGGMLPHRLSHRSRGHTCKFLVVWQVSSGVSL